MRCAWGHWFQGGLCCVGLAWLAANSALGADLGQGITGAAAGGGRCQRNQSPNSPSSSNPSLNDPANMPATLAGSARSAKKISTRERAIEQFDTDGDGQLSTAERQAARTSVNQRKRQASEAQSAPQYAGWPGYGSGFGGGGYGNNGTYANLSGMNSLLTGMSGVGSGGGGGCMNGGRR